MPTQPQAAEARDIVYPAAIPFALVHLSCLGVIWSGITWRAAGLCIALYWLRIFAIGAGYHRYFSHRAFSTGRVFQFMLAFMAQSTAQNSVLWWASKHRHHHRHSDTEQDAHSAVRDGFFYSHVGWIFDRRHTGVDYVQVEDLGRYPELRFLHRFEYLPALSLGVICFLIAGWPGVFVGFLCSTVLVYHATFAINSLAHMHGKTRYVTGDTSRNNWVLAFFTMGEGWHNNHHAYQSSVRQGFLWWEVDPTYYILRALSLIGVVWDLKAPPAKVLSNDHRLSARVIDRAARQLAANFDAERIARTLTTPHGSDATPLQVRLARARDHAMEVLSSLHMPDLPTREEIMAEARAMFAKTRSLDEIVDRARELLLAAISAHIEAHAAHAA